MRRPFLILVLAALLSLTVSGCANNQVQYRVVGMQGLNVRMLSYQIAHQSCAGAHGESACHRVEFIGRNVDTGAPLATNETRWGANATTANGTRHFPLHDLAGPRSLPASQADRFVLRFEVPDDGTRLTNLTFLREGADTAYSFTIPAPSTPMPSPTNQTTSATSPIP